MGHGPDEAGIGLAVANRLNKAAGFHIVEGVAAALQTAAARLPEKTESARPPGAGRSCLCAYRRGADLVREAVR